MLMSERRAGSEERGVPVFAITLVLSAVIFASVYAGCSALARSRAPVPVRQLHDSEGRVKAGVFEAAYVRPLAGDRRHRIDASGGIVRLRSVGPRAEAGRVQGEDLDYDCAPLERADDARSCAAGGILDAASDDPSIRGTRRLFEALAREPRLSATAIQTVGSKGHDGFVLARVVAAT